MAGPVSLASLAVAADSPALPATRAAAEDPGTPEQTSVLFFCWLVGERAPLASGASPRHAPGAAIAAMLDRIDAIIASETLRAGLLPRAPHVVPQLMKTLRDERYSSVDVASRISRDAVLTAEVIRSASGVFERSSDEGEIDLARAVAVIGTQGLRRAIASVVLRPIFDARAKTLSARAAAQIWTNADKKARLCAAVASQQSLDPFDGYLAGLLHNTGWTALLRAIDGLQDLSVSGAELTHAEVVPLLLRRRDTLFGALVEPWKLSAAVDLLANEVGRLGLDSARSPLGTALHEADRLAALEALAPAAAAA